MKFSDLKIGQLVTLDSRQKASMQLIQPGQLSSSNAPAGPGVVIELRAKGGKPLASLLVGETRVRKAAGEMAGFGGYPDGQYISPDGGRTVYLVDTTFSDLPLASRNWLDGEILNVQSADIDEISISGPDRKDVKVVKKKDGFGFEVDGLATNEVTSSSKIYSVEGALSGFRLDDVADPSTTVEQAGLDKPTVFRAVTRKGETYIIKAGKKKDGTDYRHCKIEASLKDAGKSQEPKDEAGKKAAEAAAKERKDLESAINALNGKTARWTYLVSSTKLDGMMPLREVLVEKKKDEAKTDTEQAK
jgi:hypothetical protein